MTSSSPASSIGDVERVGIADIIQGRGRTSRVPVVVNADPVNDAAFLGSGVALASFIVGDVTVDSITPGGVFWDLHSGRDVGKVSAAEPTTRYRPCRLRQHHGVTDALEQVAPEMDTCRVGAIGCSHDGESALMPGMFDERVSESVFGAASSFTFHPCRTTLTTMISRWMEATLTMDARSYFTMNAERCFLAGEALGLGYAKLRRATEYGVRKVAASFWAAHRTEP